MSVDGRLDAASVDKDLGNMRLSDGAAPSAWISGSGMGEADDSFSGAGSGTPLRIPKVAKRQGETTSKGHRNYDLMLNLQLGIRHSVGRPGPPPSLDLKPSAFDPKEKFCTNFPMEGSKNHSTTQFM